MEVHQPLDFSNNNSPLGWSSHSSILDQKPSSVLDLCVRRDRSPLSSPMHSPRSSPNSEPDVHQVTLRAHMEVDSPSRSHSAQDVKPPWSSLGVLPPPPMMQRSCSSTMYPTTNRRRTFSGLTDSSPGSSTDDRSSSAASPDLLSAFSQPSASTALKVLVSSSPVVGAGARSPIMATSPTRTLVMPQQVMSTSAPRTGKPTRPFKAYPKDPLILTAPTPGVSPVEAALGRASNEAYAEFRRCMLEQMQTANIRAAKRPLSPTIGADSCDALDTSASDSTTATSSDAGLQGLPHQTKDSFSPTQPQVGKDGKDAAYWERRRKNNEAAKRSRDARRAKEDELAIRASFLEQENKQLKYEVAALRNETAKLRCLLYSGAS